VRVAPARIIRSSKNTTPKMRGRLLSTVPIQLKNINMTTKEEETKRKRRNSQLIRLYKLPKNRSQFKIPRKCNIQISWQPEGNQTSKRLN
jgi:hypothetical protein